ncbi:MAG: hypothetical protein HDS67_02335 [Bacteroidales bacterium]|nr:hypothetical protein [Bacteroidales bacterium]
MSEILLYLEMPAYLRDWLVWSHGGVSPIRPRRGSIESNILEQYLRPWPSDRIPDRPTEGCLTIALPYFKTKDPRSNSFLPESARKLFLHSVRIQFDNDLTKSLLGTAMTRETLSDAIAAFCEARAIEMTDTSIEAVTKRWRRLRRRTGVLERVRRHRLTLKKHYKKR